MSWSVAIDVGGTFTDLVASDGGPQIHLKVPSTPQDPSAGFLDAIEHLRERVGIAREDIDLVLHGTTVITNAIIEQRLARTALLTTDGFQDVLEIGRHWRPHLYDLTAERPPTLIPDDLRFGVAERVGAGGEVVRALDEDALDEAVRWLRARDVSSVAVCLLHAYANPAHEQQVAERLRESVRYVSISSQLSREPREFERTATTALNAALMPLADDYLTRIERALDGTRVYITHSNGGAMAPIAAREQPVSLAQSGPVAGVTATADLAKALGRANVIALDMGGTSTDVALIEDGEPRLSNELRVGQVPVRLPAVQIHSVGAGGGSIASVDGQGALRVGPRSSGAYPGPACYGRGGQEPTVTDCHVVLGRLPADSRLGGFLELDAGAARTAVQEHLAGPLGSSVEEAAQAVLDITAAAMEGAIRVLLRERGSDPRDFALVPFGGAGALQAVDLARSLGIGEVIVPLHPGTFSASGLAASEVRHSFAASVLMRADSPDAGAQLAAAYAELEAEARSWFSRYSTLDIEPRVERRCDVRYLGQGYDVSVPLVAAADDEAALARLVEDFHAAHERAYAFASPGDPCEIQTIRLSLSARPARRAGDSPAGDGRDVAPRTAPAILDGRSVECHIVDRRSLAPGDSVPVPCVLVQEDATIVVPPGVRATVHDSGALIISEIPAA